MGKKERRLRNLRRRIWERDHGSCWLCHGPILSKRTMTLDHVTPKSKGGKYSFDNLRAAHRSCNEARGDKMVMPLNRLLEPLEPGTAHSGARPVDDDPERYAG